MKKGYRISELTALWNTDKGNLALTRAVISSFSEQSLHSALQDFCKELPPSIADDPQIKYKLSMSYLCSGATSKALKLLSDMSSDNYELKMYGFSYVSLFQPGL